MRRAEADSRLDVLAPRALRKLMRWRRRHMVRLSPAVLRVLLAHVILWDGPLRSARSGVDRVLRLLCDPALPPICLPGTPGRLDPFSPGRAYVADPACASRNLVERLSTDEWRLVRAAAAAEGPPGTAPPPNPEDPR